MPLRNVRSNLNTQNTGKPQIRRMSRDKWPRHRSYSSERQSSSKKITRQSSTGSFTRGIFGYEYRPLTVKNGKVTRNRFETGSAHSTNRRERSLSSHKQRRARSSSKPSSVSKSPYSGPRGHTSPVLQSRNPAFQKPKKAQIPPGKKKQDQTFHILKNMDKLVGLLKTHSNECPKFARELQKLKLL